MSPEQHAARRLEDQAKQARGIARWLRAQAEECRRLADDVERFWT